VGSTATYTCWPGYNYVSGDTSRECLPSLVWSGRRPTCRRACSAIHPQTCRNSRFRRNNEADGCVVTEMVVDTTQACKNTIQESGPLSAYYVPGLCRTSDCEINVIDSTNSAERTFFYSCYDSEYIYHDCLHIVMSSFVRSFTLKCDRYI